MNRKHGLSCGPLYFAWGRMKQRCLNPRHPKYPIYGGRGIVICKRWVNSFAAFREDMGASYHPGLSLDRIDNNGPYSPENCRWADSTTQNRNRRLNHRVTFRGETKTIAEWAEIIAIDRSLLSWRILKGWPIEKAMTQQTGAPNRSHNEQGEIVGSWTLDEICALRQLYPTKGSIEVAEILQRSVVSVRQMACRLSVTRKERCECQRR
jgi:hypothetical protein